MGELRVPQSSIWPSDFCSEYSALRSASGAPEGRSVPYRRGAKSLDSFLYGQQALSETVENENDLLPILSGQNEAQ